MSAARGRADAGEYVRRVNAAAELLGAGMAMADVDRQVIPWPGCHVIPWLAVDVLPGLVWCCQWWRVDDFADLSGEVFGRRAAEAGGEDGLAVAAA